MARHRFPSGRECIVWTRLNGFLCRSLVDTGSRYLVVTPGVVEACGGRLTGEHSPRISTAASSQEVPARPVYSIESVQALGVTASNVEAIVLDLPPGCGFAGLLGVSFLRHFRLEADYGAGWIELKPETETHG